MSVCSSLLLFSVCVCVCFLSPQVLRSHVMVRVGGGWDTLEHYLDKHDPCRCAAFGEVTSCRPPTTQTQPHCCLSLSTSQIWIVLRVGPIQIGQCLSRSTGCNSGQQFYSVVMCNIAQLADLATQLAVANSLTASGG